ncbi:L,D-transpeptidase [Hyphomicrobium sp. CS1GBMeth3]|uniref:L,D-transpeptidase n=1 Tax=Hyphomicrobium sp. CS1GBMeth3 TaxID=1892845 RepID=UPI000A5FF29D|nr:L,D-transpeptidase [Hyphomicrobium sp. CS1GBMeth3]
MRWDFAIRAEALISLVMALLMAGSAAMAAGNEPENTGAQNAVPTVTVINKAPDAAPAAGTELKVSPAPQKQPATAPAPVKGADAPKDEPAKQPDTKTAADKGDPQAKKSEPVPLPEPTLAIDIDLTRQIMTVSEEGEKRHTWRMSSARYGYRTPTGTYRPTWMAKMWYSRQYDLAPMPHAIFFHKGVAIHGTYDTGALGRPASHGCVRLAPKNAAALYKLVSSHGKDRTEIVVHGKPGGYMDDEVADAPSSRDRYGDDYYDDDYEETQRLPRSARAYRYLPPNYYSRRYAYDDYYYDRPRPRRRYAAPARPPRYPYGYGF